MSWSGKTEDEYILSITPWIVPTCGPLSSMTLDVPAEKTKQTLDSFMNDGSLSLSHHSLYPWDRGTVTLYLQGGTQSLIHHLFQTHTTTLLKMLLTHLHPGSEK